MHEKTSYTLLWKPFKTNRIILSENRVPSYWILWWFFFVKLVFFLLFFCLTCGFKSFCLKISAKPMIMLENEVSDNLYRNNWKFENLHTHSKYQLFFTIEGFTDLLTQLYCHLQALRFFPARKKKSQKDDFFSRKLKC